MLVQILAATAAFNGLAVGTSKVSVSMMAKAKGPAGFWEEESFINSRTSSTPSRGSSPHDGFVVGQFKNAGLGDDYAPFWKRPDWKAASEAATASQPIQPSPPTNKPGGAFKFGW